ncbi:hypothetical protein [Qipengyuania oceanensis]|uniref:Uncharacterized protein n=1 Tax=Qipengyuania oceanensis TaxID=1463597 RepID=A0A844YCV9_9SPHN|nr:hypothetical protein [Qipengyuania oceanensis]MXO62360.1 hypothetical protein [Qipengyuania oceanensis]
MKKIIAVATLAIVTACSQAEPAPEPTEEAVAETEVMAADGQSPVGTYKITLADGSEYTEVLSPDGTYTSTGPDGQVESGRWEQRSPEQYCSVKDEQFREEGDSDEMECSTEGIDEAGVWTSTNTKGETVTVARADAAAPAAEPAAAE